GLESQLLRTIAVSIPLLPSEADEFAARAGLPKPEIAVCGSSDQVASVRGESQAGGPVLFSNPTAGGPEALPPPAPLNTPDPTHPILARRRRRSPVGRDCPHEPEVLIRSYDLDANPACFWVPGCQV